VSNSQTDASLAAVPDQFDPSAGGISAYDTPLGITNPPIDELLERVSSKYALVIYAAKRARHGPQAGRRRRFWGHCRIQGRHRRSPAHRGELPGPRHPDRIRVAIRRGCHLRGAVR